MKNRYIYLTVLAALGLTACEPEFDQELEDTPITAQESGDADFSKYVAVGASITAGYADGAVYIDGQDSAFPKLIAEKMEAAGGGTFTTPFMADNIGGFAGVYDEDENLAFNSRLVYNVATGAPELYTDSPANSITDFVTGYYSNMGIPGMKSFHSLFAGYGASAGVSVSPVLTNPYFARIASSDDATVIGDAVAQDPTFFSLWLGGNDVLDYATTGGTGDLQDITTEIAPEDGDITDTTYFAGVYSTALSSLTANGASGVLFNVPAVTDLPYFTTVGYNVIPMDAATAEATNTAYSGYNTAVAYAYSLGYIDADEYAARTISFSESTSNAVVIVDEDLTDLTAIDAAVLNYRQATEEDLLVLTAASVIGTLADATDATTVYGVGVPLGDEFVLTPEEQELISDATTSYNTTIAALAAADANLMLFDANTLLTTLKDSGITSEGTTVTGDISLTGAFSLDGIHLNPRGNAVFANMVIEDINDYFGSTLQLHDPIYFSTLTFK